MIKKKHFISALLTFLIPASIMAFDKAKLIDHLAKAMNVDPSIKLVLGEPKPSMFKGLLEVDLTIKTKRGDQSRKMYVSKDGKKYIFGAAFDTAIDPDEERAKKINLRNVYYKGSSKAPVTIVEFSDLQCGFCKKAHNILNKELYSNYSKKDVRLVFKQFPLDSHKWAKPGAIATECAGQQGQKSFWDMTDLFFENVPNITPENVNEKAMEFAKELGLNKKQFKACLESDLTKKKVESDRKEGIRVGVSSTPTFLINGRMLRGFSKFETLKPIINQKLKEAKK